MKRSNIRYMLLIIGVLIIILSACSKKKSEKSQPYREANETGQELVEDEVDEEKIMKDFNNIVESENPPEKVISYIEEHIDKLTDIEGDHMISQLEKVLGEFLEPTTDNIINLDKNHELISLGGDDLFFPQEKIKDIKNQELQDELVRALDNKYKLINLEGNYYPIIDYEKLKEYSEYISPELKDYLGIKGMDSGKPVALDGALYISYEELGERIIKTEDYIKKYPEGQKYEEILRAYRNKLSIYLSGIDNSPIYDYETGKINNHVLESYKKIGNTKDSITGFIVRKYLNTIEEADYIINEDIEGDVLSLVNEALSLLEVTK